MNTMTMFIVLGPVLTGQASQLELHRQSYFARPFYVPFLFL